MSALEQVKCVIKALQTSFMVLLTKVVRNVNLKTSTILAIFGWVYQVALQINPLQFLKFKQRYVKTEDKQR